MEVGIIGHSEHGHSVLKQAIVKTLEEKKGEKVEIVELSSEERGVIISGPPIDEPIPFTYDRIDMPFIPPMPKIKGHQRPYKYHK